MLFRWGDGSKGCGWVAPNLRGLLNFFIDTEENRTRSLLGRMTWKAAQSASSVDRQTNQE